METENLKRNCDETQDGSGDCDENTNDDIQSIKRPRENETEDNTEEEDNDKEGPSSPKPGGSDDKAELSDNCSLLSAGDQDLIANIVTECYLSQKMLEDLTSVAPANEYGPVINEGIATHWDYITKNGISKESQEEIVSKSLIPENCQFLEAPILNTEIRAMLSEKVAKKDNILYRNQNNLGKAMASVALALNALLDDKNNTIVISKHISNAGRLLCNLFHHESSVRRKLASNTLTKEDQHKLLSETVIGKHLYGDSNLIEILLNLDTEKIQGPTNKFNGPNYQNKSKQQPQNQYSNRPGKSNQQQNRAANFKKQHSGPGNFKQQHFGPGNFKQQHFGPGNFKQQHFGPGNFKQQHFGPGTFKQQQFGLGKFRPQYNGPSKWQNQRNGPGKWQNQHNGPGKWQNQRNGPGKWQNQHNGPGKWKHQQNDESNDDTQNETANNQYKQYIYKFDSDDDSDSST